MNHFERAAAEHRDVLARSVGALSPTFADVAELVAARLLGGSRVFVCGNGGSAADAQHFAAELVGRFVADRQAMPVMALHTDTSTLTAIANDTGYDRVFSRQVEAFARSGDVLLAISTSGRSPNVVEAARLARAMGLAVVAMTGSDGAALTEHADHLLAVPSANVARIQEVHGILLHSLAETVEAALLDAGDGHA